MADETVRLLNEIREECRAILDDMRSIGPRLDRISDQLHETNRLAGQAFQIGREAKNLADLRHQLNLLLHGTANHEPRI